MPYLVKNSELSQCDASFFCKLTWPGSSVKLLCSLLSNNYHFSLECRQIPKELPDLNSMVLWKMTTFRKIPQKENVFCFFFKDDDGNMTKMAC